MFEKPNEEWALFVILTQDMNKRMQYLVEGIAKDIIAYRNSHLKTPKSSV